MQTHSFVQDRIDRFDEWFADPEEEKLENQQSRFRFGLIGEMIVDKDDRFDFKPVLDLEADLSMRNLERRTKLVISTIDPNQLPGTDITDQQDSTIRAGVSRGWGEKISTGIGIRARWPPEAYANATWGDVWHNGDWKIYPHQRFYWESDEGVGEISSIVFDRWKNRWDLRLSSSLKWSANDRRDDHDFDRKDEGFRFSETVIFGYAQELLNEDQMGQRIAGRDLARGGGIRASVFTGFHYVDEYRCGLFYKQPLRRRWLFLVFGPEVSWRRETKWDREWTIKLGFDILFWGTKDQ